MPKKQPTCKVCKHKLTQIPAAKGGNGYGHKKKEHWTGRPHKAIPQWVEEPPKVQAS
jgi:hypothetical protein